MKYIAAVSGGVDSVALLDMLTKKFSPEQLVAAHFEHGIRGDTSREDALFVEKLSQKYGLECEIEYGNLTKNASEDEARTRRYEFLKRVAAKHGGQLLTAHHQDDLIETIAINLVRGTGWRGLAVFGDNSVLRPLAMMRKEDIYAYALKYGLEWVEDETNQTDDYLRNRLRRRIHTALTDRQRATLLELYQAQTVLMDKISDEADMVAIEQLGDRYFLTMVPEKVAVELLRRITKGKLLRTQCERALLAIKTFRPGSTFEAGAGVTFVFTRRRFIVTNTSRVL